MNQQPTTQPASRTEMPSARAARRSEGWQSAFFWLLLLGLVGAAVLAFVASERTTLTSGMFGGMNTETTHDVGLGIAIFLGGAMAALLTALPMLGFRQILLEQAELLRRTETTEAAIASPPRNSAEPPTAPDGRS